MAHPSLQSSLELRRNGKQKQCSPMGTSQHHGTPWAHRGWRKAPGLWGALGGMCAQGAAALPCEPSCKHTHTHGHTDMGHKHRVGVHSAQPLGQRALRAGTKPRTHSNAEPRAALLLWGGSRGLGAPSWLCTVRPTTELGGLMLMGGGWRHSRLENGGENE